MASRRFLLSTTLRTLLLAAFGASLLSSSAVAGDDSVLGSAKKGEKVFNTYCVACHGPTGEGNGPAGGALNPPPRNFTDASIMHTLSDEHLIKVITEGGASVGKSPLMPPWGASLKPNEIRDVAAYVRAFAGPPPAAEATEATD